MRYPRAYAGRAAAAMPEATLAVSLRRLQAKNTDAELPPISVATHPGWNTTDAIPWSRQSGSISRNRSFRAHFEAP